MNAAILDEGGTVMQYVGDAVMAVFGAPFPQPTTPTARCARRAAMHERQQRAQRAVARRGAARRSGSGIGVSTGEVAAALLGSEERLEYTLVGDTVNLAQRLQDLARPPGRPCQRAHRTRRCTRDAGRVPLDGTAAGEGAGHAGGGVRIAGRVDRTSNGECGR